MNDPKAEAAYHGRDRTLGCMWCNEESCDHGAYRACHAVNLEEGRPANNPPHVCVLAGGHITDHEDYSGFKWRKPGHPHELVVP